jgi:hypothetical protein
LYIPLKIHETVAMELVKGLGCVIAELNKCNHTKTSYRIFIQRRNKYCLSHQNEKTNHVLALRHTGQSGRPLARLV